ncbi:MAG: methyltransferase domain-containing protein [Candidatus Pacebacteria bacterium]|nr:methyltransferase domain-containing protein [Candidatus Paceibacterota bacterium]MCF7857299.1 methyltransferase domain-containing protein [Candidatus Paceibacterota bacterium]
MYPATFGKFIEPTTLCSHFHLREGDSVVDFGAGSGHFIKPLADLVGKSGSVYLCEIQKTLVDALGIKAQELQLSNVHPIWCDLEAVGGTKINDGSLDAGILVNTLFQLEEKNIALSEMARVLRKGGKLFIIDWTDSFGGLGPHQGSVVSESDAKTLAESCGFSFERSFPAGDHHYGIGLRKL